MEEQVPIPVDYAQDASKAEIKPHGKEDSTLASK